MLYVERRNTESRLAAVAMYVRAHLDERLTLDGLGAIACFSPFHFHRIFRVAFGENLNAYVVRHRMMRAANELRYSERSVTDIALGCGYDSPSAFGRAFSRAFGAAPSAYRMADGTPARIAPRDVPSADTIPEPRLEDFNATDALSLRFDGPYDELEPTVRRLYGIARRRGLMPHASIFGLSYGSPDLQEHESLRFEACVTTIPGADVEGAIADGLRPIEIPGGRHAVFRHVGPYHRITHAYDLLVAAWILTDRIALRDGPFVNRYISDPAATPESALECDLAIPIR